MFVFVGYVTILILTFITIRAIDKETDFFKDIFFDDVAQFIFPAFMAVFWPITLFCLLVAKPLIWLSQGIRWIVREATNPKENVA